MNIPKISLIVGAFNRPGRLRTCLACLADQTFENFEVVIVDNSDNEEAISLQRKYTEDLNDPRFRYEHIGERAFDPVVGIRSLYDASEIGFSMTTGEWVAWPNDDSYMVPWFLERMMQRAEAEDKPEFVYCDIVIGRPDIAHYALNCVPVGCSIDKTCFMFKREWMPAEWPGKRVSYGVADGDLVNHLVNSGIRHGKVPQLLCVHN